MIEPRGQSRTVRRHHRGDAGLRRGAWGVERLRSRSPPGPSAGGGEPALRPRLQPDTRTGRGRSHEIRTQEPETRKTASGVTPGGLRIRLPWKETVRGPLGGSLLLVIRARIERKGEGDLGGRDAGERGCGHAAAGLTGETADDRHRDRERGAERARARAKRRMPGTLPAERLAGHGQMRATKPVPRFRQVVLKGEDHRTLTAAPARGSRSPCFGLLRVGRETLRTGAAFNL